MAVTPPNIVKRLVKQQPLVAQEMDDNLQDLLDYTTAVETTFANGTGFVDNTIDVIRLVHPNTAGQFLIDQTSGTPLWATMSGDATLAADGALTLSPGASFPIGGIIPLAGPSVPANWLACNGQEVLQSAWALLFAQIQHIYGTAAANHFKVPDLRGRVVVADDLTAGRMATNDGAGYEGGEETHLLTGAESGTSAHRHVYINYYHSGSSHCEGGGGSPHGSGLTEESAEADALNEHNNMPPYQVVSHYIIRAS